MQSKEWTGKKRCIDDENDEAVDEYNIFCIMRQMSMLRDISEQKK